MRRTGRHVHETWQQYRPDRFGGSVGKETAVAMVLPKDAPVPRSTVSRLTIKVARRQAGTPHLRLIVWAEVSWFPDAEPLRGNQAVNLLQPVLALKAPNLVRQLLEYLHIKYTKHSHSCKQGFGPIL